MYKNIYKAINNEKYYEHGISKNKVIIIFSNEGYTKAFAEQEAFLIFEWNKKTHEHEKYMGHKFEIDKNQKELFTLKII